MKLVINIDHVSGHCWNCFQGEKSQRGQSTFLADAPWSMVRRRRSSFFNMQGHNGRVRNNQQPWCGYRHDGTF